MSRPSNPFTLEFIFSRAVAQPPPDYCAHLGDCMIWPDESVEPGYGRAKFESGWCPIHIASYTIVNGPVPEGLFVCHLCDRKRCVAPAHLVARTPAWNTQDMYTKRRMSAKPVVPSRSNKLTEDDVRAIRVDRRPGLEIASDYGISRGYVYDVKAGKTWRWLED